MNKEYQSTNKELLASKEELRSLDEELNALNSQLQEALERQRTTPDDLQRPFQHQSWNDFSQHAVQHPVLHTTTKAFFNVIPKRLRAPARKSRVARGQQHSPGRHPNSLQESDALGAESRGGAVTRSCAESSVPSQRPEDRRRRYHL